MISFLNSSSSELTAVLLDLGQCRALFLLVAWQIFYTLSRLNELNRVELANNLARVLRLQVLLADVP